jgi:hypothetical protein
MTGVPMPVNQTAVGACRMLRMTVMSHTAPLKPAALRVTFAHPAAPLVMPSTVSQARLSASPVVTIMAPGQPVMPGRAMAFNLPGGITDTGT